MLELYEHNKADCIRLLNMIICEIPFIKTFNDDCLLERLLNLISIITAAFDGHTAGASLHDQHEAIDTDEERELSIREWLLRHYNSKCFIDDLNFGDPEDRTRVTVLIINILFKLRHSLKDIEQYLKDCDSFVQFDRQLNQYTRFDKLLEMVSNDCNKWRSESREYKVKLEETKKLMDKYQQNEIFNYNCNPRNQNLYKSRIGLNPVSDECLQRRRRALETPKVVKRRASTSATDSAPELADCERHMNGYDSDGSDDSDRSVNNEVICYICVECDKNYSTNFEFNLHVLKDHKNVDISDIIRNANVNTDLDISVETSGGDTTEKKCRNQKKRVFKCVYNKCGKAFYRLNELKRHFVRHQPKVERFVFIYSDYMNASLNHIRTTVPLKSSHRRSSPQSHNTELKPNVHIIHNHNNVDTSNASVNHITGNSGVNYFVNDSRVSHPNAINYHENGVSSSATVSQFIANNEINGNSMANEYHICNETADEGMPLAHNPDEQQTQEDYCFGLRLKNNKTYSAIPGFNGFNGDGDSNPESDN